MTVQDAGGARYQNDWDLWVYPVVEPVVSRDEVLVTTKIDTAVARAADGATGAAGSW